MAAALTAREAERVRVKLRAGISGTAGSGKTVAAIMIAYGLTGDWKKIAAISSEPNQSLDLYAEKFGKYKLIDLVERENPDEKIDYSPERYIEAIRLAESLEGVEVLIIDGISQEWSWVLDAVEASGKGQMAWKDFTPRHDAFMQAMMTSRCHVIMTCRRVTDWLPAKDEKGRNFLEKIGTKDYCRDRWDYDLQLHFVVDANEHMTKAYIDRTELFVDEKKVPVPFRVDMNTGVKIKDWVNQGTDLEQEKNEMIANLKMADKMIDVGVFWDGLTVLAQKNVEVHQAIRNRSIEVVELAKDGKDLQGYKHLPLFVQEDRDIQKAIINKAVELLAYQESIEALTKFWNDMCGGDAPALPFVKKNDNVYASGRAVQQSLVKWNEIKTVDEFVGIYKTLPFKPTQTDLADIKRGAQELMRRCNTVTELMTVSNSLVGNKEGTIAPSLQFLRDDKDFIASVGQIYAEIKAKPVAPIDLPDFEKENGQQAKAGNGKKEVTKKTFKRKDGKTKA